MFLELLAPLWLGILTSISPCPLATNIAAVSYIGKQVTMPQKVLLSGALYSVGRALSYLIVGFLVLKGILSIPVVATFLQEWINVILGPLLIIISLFLFNVINLDFSFSLVDKKTGEYFKDFGLIGALLIGIVFALSFCPISAGIFFGSLIPLSLKVKSVLIYPLLYGIGTALPVLFFAILISLGVSTVGKIYNKLVQFEGLARIITAVIFIAAGIYFILKYIFKLPLNIF